MSITLAQKRRHAIDRTVGRLFESGDMSKEDAAVIYDIMHPRTGTGLKDVLARVYAPNPYRIPLALANLAPAPTNEPNPGKENA